MTPNATFWGYPNQGETRTLSSQTERNIMAESNRLRIARRVSALLQRELGEGVDCQRMLAQPLYARDVLLVCEALHESEGPDLAASFRDDAVPAATGPLPQAAIDTPDSTAADSPDSTPSGWVASLWPATMRGGWLNGRGRRRTGKTPPV
jgi:hypothetical protein